MLPFMLFWLLYPNWGSTLYGEVRGSGDFRKVLNGMLGGIWVTAILAIVFVLLAAKTFGWVFFNATNVTYVNYVLRLHDDRPDGAHLGLSAAAGVVPDRQHIFQMAMIVLFGAWFLGWTGTLFLSSTRMIFAAAFDRILPEWAAGSPRVAACRGRAAADHGPVGRPQRPVRVLGRRSGR